MSTDTSERGLESLVVAALTGLPVSDTTSGRAIAETSIPYGGAGYVLGDSADYDRAHTVDLVKLLDFLQRTQPKVVEQLGLAEDGPRRQQFLARLQGEVAKRGVVDVLRKGIKHGPASLDLFYGTPSPGNPKAAERFAANTFSVTGFAQEVVPAQEVHRAAGSGGRDFLGNSACQGTFWAKPVSPDNSATAGMSPSLRSTSHSSSTVYPSQPSS